MSPSSLSLLPLPVSAVKVLHHNISASQYEGLLGEDLVNLAVVLKDQASFQIFLASEEINVPSAELSIQVGSISLNPRVGFHTDRK